MLGDQAAITDPYFDAINDIEAHGRVRCELGGYHALVEVKSTPKKASFAVSVDLEQIRTIPPFYVTPNGVRK